MVDCRWLAQWKGIFLADKETLHWVNNRHGFTGAKNGSISALSPEEHAG